MRGTHDKRKRVPEMGVLAYFIRMIHTRFVERDDYIDDGDGIAEGIDQVQPADGGFLLGTWPLLWQFQGAWSAPEFCEHQVQKPFFSLDSHPLLLAMVQSRDAVTPENSLYSVERRDIGLKLPKSAGCPFLKI